MRGPAVTATAEFESDIADDVQVSVDCNGPVPGVPSARFSADPDDHGGNGGDDNGGNDDGGNRGPGGGDNSGSGSGSGGRDHPEDD